MEEFFGQLSSFASDHEVILAVVGLPILTLVVTSSVNRANARRAERDRAAERKLAAELKIAEFRQAWIIQLRETFAKLLSSATDENDAAFRPPKLESAHRIYLMINPQDPLYDELTQKLNTLFSSGLSKDDNAQILVDTTILAQKLLKQEWDRLKNDLSRVS